MIAPPPLFDETLRLSRRERAARGAVGGSEAMHALHAHAAAGLAERLEPINRVFPSALVAAAADGAYAARLRGRFGIERLTQIEQSPALTARLRRKAPSREAVLAGALDEATLSLPEAPAPGSLDLVVIGLDLHGRNDPIAALAQARMLLKPDGLLLASLIGGESLWELRACLAEAEIEICGGLSPRVAPMGEIRDLGGLLQRAGYAMPVADSERLTLWHRSPIHLMREIRAVGEANIMHERRRVFLRRDVLARSLELYAERHSRSDGKTSATLEIVTLTGWAPAETQPKPLRPGSATARLADALGSIEQSAGDKAGG